MISNFYMPTRIVAGQGSLGEIGKLARDLKMSKVLVVSDPVLAKQSFHADAIAALKDAGVKPEQFNECGIDARCSHIDEQGERVVRLANGTDYGLMAAVWSFDGNRAVRVSRGIKAGQVYINSFGAGGGIELPFGGMKKSGHGREKGFASAARRLAA